MCVGTACVYYFFILGWAHALMTRIFLMALEEMTTCGQYKVITFPVSAPSRNLVL